MIHRALTGAALELYGNGLNVRDWLYVKDHCEALFEVFRYGAKGERYNIGGNQEFTNLELITHICKKLDEVRPLKEKKYEQFITFVPDRLGHDLRYAIDNSKIQKKINWKPKTRFDDGIMRTIRWYCDQEQCK